MYTQKEVLDFVEQEDVKFIRLAFFDISGKQKNISIMPNELQKAFENGISFDASAIFGFASPEKSDLFLHPDPSTLSLIPWRPSQGKVARMFCDIKYSDGKDYEKDCRHLLKCAIEKAKNECGISLMIGTEIEFYLFKLDSNGEPTKIPFDNAGYMAISPEDKGENIRRDICFTLEDMGITPERSHHEEGPGQNEIDFHYATPLKAADNTSTFKWTVRTKAYNNGLWADFSPKPLQSKPGSGMHINISCSVNSKMPNILAGILLHAKEMSYFLNPTENSYLRLGEYKAPKYITWGKENRTTLIRLPASKNEQRLELRSSDPECNPYIVFALLIHAAIDGIKKNLTPPNEVSENLFAKQNEKNLAFETLPKSLEEAKKIAMQSDFITSIIGK